MDDEEWLNYRRKMNKLLLKGDLTWIEDCCQASNDLFLDRIAKTSGQQFIDLERTLYKWSIDTVLSVLMGADSYRSNHRNIECLAQKLADDVKKVFETTCKLQLISATIAAKYNIPRWRKFEETVTDALSTANQTLDMIDKYVGKHEGLLAKMRAEAIEEDIIRTIVVDLMLGAGDTTSNTMIWALYLLGRDNQVQESVRSDLSASMLRYTIKETLRLYPAAPFLTRILPETIEVGGYQIPKHTLIVMSIYTSGRNERFYENAQKFLPARWCREYSSAIPIPKNASLPFGIGARSCVGRKIAEAQLQGALGKILKEYKVQLLDNNEVEDVLEMITKPERSVRLAFIRI
ncbi:unnamed protein product [Callosobruchus maculatus]|uniref:Cytochrome P450 n=2 Tax=Callosobruchus maculatus TaxID=64391 RepID=A0A653BYR5_CALMS|nr:unnamed protein product [Callosobruchus maculatus]